MNITRINKERKKEKKKVRKKDGNFQTIRKEKKIMKLKEKRIKKKNKKKFNCILTASQPI